MAPQGIRNRRRLVPARRCDLTSGQSITHVVSSSLSAVAVCAGDGQIRADLDAVTWTVRRIDLQDVPALPSTERVSRLRDRLSEPEMAAVVANYSGTSVTQLTRQYDINR